MRGPGRDVDRDVRKAVCATVDEKERFAVDAGGALVFPARVREVRPDGVLVLDYDHGGDGVELPENVRPRMVLPWHPRNVPLHLMLRRNVGRGKDPLEGLQVRWWYVARLQQALCAFPRNGHGPWHINGAEDEPMHKYYDPKLFHMMSEEEMKVMYAPKVSDGVILGDAEADALNSETALRQAVDVTEPEHFIAAGFDVNFVGPDAYVLPAGDGASGADEARDDEKFVEEDVFVRWLDLSEMRVASVLARWWRDEPPCEEGGVGGLKHDDDETTVDLFGRIRDEIGQEQEDRGEKRDGVVRLGCFVKWLRRNLASELGLDDTPGSDEILADQVLHDLTIVSKLALGQGDDRGCMQEAVDHRDEDEEAVRLAERLVYGWPSKEAEATGAASRGRFVKAHPLNFPMDIGDLNQERPRKVSPEV